MVNGQRVLPPVPPTHGSVPQLKYQELFWEETGALPSAMKHSVFPRNPYQTARHPSDGLPLYVKLQGRNLNIQLNFLFIFSKELLTACHCGLENVNAFQKICWQQAPRIVSACLKIPEKFPLNIFHV